MNECYVTAWTKVVYNSPASYRRNKKQVFCEWIRDHGDHPVGVGTTGTNSTLNNLSPNTVVNNIYSIYSKYVQPKVKLLNLNYSACRKSKKFFFTFHNLIVNSGNLRWQSASSGKQDTCQCNQLVNLEFNGCHSHRLSGWGVGVDGWQTTSATTPAQPSPF